MKTNKITGDCGFYLSASRLNVPELGADIGFDLIS